MSDIDINEVQKNIEELQDQNTIDFQQWKRLGREIERLEGKIKLSDNHLNLLMKKIKADYEKLRKVIIDENVQIELNNKIEENKKEINTKVNFETFNSSVNSINEQLETKAIIVNVKSFGAKGDGFTDDRLCIQNAIDFASNFPNSSIYFPEGIYIIKTTTTNYMEWNGSGSFEGQEFIKCGLVWKGINQHWFGDGMEKTTLKLVADEYSNGVNGGSVGSFIVLESRDDINEHINGNMFISNISLNGNYEECKTLEQILTEGCCINGFAKRNAKNIGKLYANNCKFIAPFKENIRGRFSGEFFECDFEQGKPSILNLHGGVTVISDSCNFHTDETLCETYGDDNFIIKNSNVTTLGYGTFCNDNTCFYAENTNFNLPTVDKMVFYNRCKKQVIKNCNIYYNSISTSSDNLPFFGATETILENCNFYNKGNVALLGNLEGKTIVNDCTINFYNSSTELYEDILQTNVRVGNYADNIILNEFPKAKTISKTRIYGVSNTWASDGFFITKYLPVYLVFEMTANCSISGGGFWGDSSLAIDEITNVNVIAGNRYCIRLKKCGVAFTNKYTKIGAFLRCDNATNGSAWMTTYKDGIMLN